VQFIIYALDKPDGGAARGKNRDAHRARLREHDHPIKIISAGPLLSGDDPIGSVFIIEAENADQVRAFIAADPYVINDVYESFDIRPVKWTIGTAPGS
jgi:uncharacterized protein YciI